MKKKDKKRRFTKICNSTPKNRRIWIALQAICAVATGVSAVIYGGFWKNIPFENAPAIGIRLLLTAAVSMIIWVAFYVVKIKPSQNAGAVKRIVAACAAAIIPALLVGVQIGAPLSDHAHIRIRAADGQSAVYLREGIYIDGVRNYLNDLKAPGMDMVEENLLRFQGQEFVLTCNRYDRIVIILGTGSDSGVTEIISAGGSVQYMDTYTEEPGERRVRVDYEARSFSPIFIAGCLINLYLCVAYIFLLAAPLFYRAALTGKVFLAFATVFPCGYTLVMNRQMRSDFIFASLLPAINIILAVLALSILIVGSIMILRHWRSLGTVGAAVICVSVLIALMASQACRSFLTIRKAEDTKVTYSVSGVNNIRSTGFRVDFASGICVDNVPISEEKLDVSNWHGASVAGALPQLSVNGPPGAEIEITFRTGPDAGIMNTTAKTQIDLYSPVEGTKFTAILFPAPSVDELKTPFLRLAAFMCFAVISYLCLSAALLIRAFVKKRLRDEEFGVHGFEPVVLSCAMPVIFLIYQYAKNSNELDFSHIALITLFCVALSIGAYFLARWICGSSTRAFSLVAAAWIPVLFYNYIFTLLYNEEKAFTRDMYNLIFFLTAFVFLSAAFYCGGLLKKNGYRLVEVFFAAILVMNLVTLVPRAFAGSSKEGVNKTEFSVDADTPSPNIYWFHSDGMISFEEVAHFFGDPQEGFVQQLEDRDFILNRGAWFEAGGYTQLAVPSLMCPSVYDGYLSQYFISDSMLKRDTDLWNMLVDTTEFARQNNELLAAFRTKGYETNVISEIGYGYNPANTNNFYHTQFYLLPGNAPTYLPPLINASNMSANFYKNLTNIRNLNTLLTSGTITTLFNPILTAAVEDYEKKNLSRSEIDIPNTEARHILGEEFPGYGVTMIRSLRHSLSGQSPRLTVIWNTTAHGAFYFNEDGSYLDVMPDPNVLRYHAQHRYSARVTINMIDMVLESDPSAVIILQADHGIHMLQNINDLRGLGYTDNDIYRLRNSVVSAVRIPEEWGGLDAPLDPLNIARELVNRYVGTNYDLLPSDQPNQKGDRFE